MSAFSRTSQSAAWLAACFIAVYAFDIGHGFIKDDYGWIASSHLSGWPSLGRMFTQTPMGFYRPLVALSFGLNEQLSLTPFTYAITNLLFALGIAGGVFQLARRLGVAPPFALFAAAVWAFNFHGINMSLLWISGRTSLLGALFAVWAAVAFTSSRVLLAGVLTLAALLSKEEPLLLPAVFAAWLWIDGVRGRALVAPVLPAAVAVALYLGVRAMTPALTPANAPDYYRLSVIAGLGNAAQYADRSLTFATALLLVLWLAFVRQPVPLRRSEARLVVKGLAWLVGMFALTILLPVRSSLYVVLPSIGAAIAAGATAAAMARVATSRVPVGVLLALPLALWPVYHARNARIRNEAQLASATITALNETLAQDPDRRVVIISPIDARPSIADAFSSALPEAIGLFVPTATNANVMVVNAEPERRAGDVVYRVSGGTLVKD